MKNRIVTGVRCVWRSGSLGGRPDHLVKRPILSSVLAAALRMNWARRFLGRVHRPVGKGKPQCEKAYSVLKR
jgi:hypothetical protein